jgi:hypothetical protein
MVDNEDGEQLWKHDIDDAPELLVPIIPTLGMFQEVFIQKINLFEEGLPIKIFMDGPEPGGSSSITRQFIGFLMPGEGRMALRHLVVNYLDTALLGYAHICRAPGHGIREEQLWQKSSLTDAQLFINRYHVFLHGKCKWCLEKAIQNDDESDLIPGGDEDEGTAWSRLHAKDGSQTHRQRAEEVKAAQERLKKAREEAVRVRKEAREEQKLIEAKRLAEAFSKKITKDFAPKFSPPDEGDLISGDF